MSTNPEARAWVTVRADAIRRNYGRIREVVGPTVGLIPMVKADAYGVGMDRVVSLLEPLDPWGFGVATADEGARLRAAGVSRPVVVVSPLPPTALREALELGLDVSVSSAHGLREVSAASARHGLSARVQVEIDSGMGRSGCTPAEVSELSDALQALAGTPVSWVGCFTHLHSADTSAETVHEQWQVFQRSLTALPRPPEGAVVHVLNSAGALGFPGYACDAVRPGIFLYGGGVGPDRPSPEPVVSVHARVVRIRNAAPGTTLGYGATYQARSEERWATLAIGYGDGLPRALGNRGRAVLNGRGVAVIGRVSMDVTVVNITDVPGVGVGDIATLVGAGGEQGVQLDEVAELAGTISYEVLTGLSSRLPRVWTGIDGS